VFSYRSNYSEQVSPQLRWITESQLEELHSATIEVLERTGVRVEHPESLQLLREAGCIVRGETAFIPSWLVEESIRSAPKKVTLANRLGQRVMSLEKNRTYFGPGSDLPFNLDLYTGERRKSVLEDIENSAVIVDYLDNYDFMMSNAIASDVPEEQADLLHFEAMLLNTIKPIIFTALSEDNTYKVIKMAASAIGGYDNLKQFPTIALYSEPISPLVHTYQGIEKMFICLEHGVPVIYTPGVLAGGTCPVSKAGTIVQMNAESLSGLVIAQLKYKGSPVIIGGGATPMDMKTTATLYGSPDAQMNFCAMTALSQYYGIPNFIDGGCSNSPIPDAQAGMEAFMGLLMSQLSGANLVHDVGYLAGGTTGSAAFLVMCDEFISAARYIGSGTTINEETLSVDLIDKVGPRGQYVSEDNTMENFKKEIWMPELFNRFMVWEQWQKEGEKSFHDRAVEKAQKILSDYKPVTVNDNVRNSIKNVIKGV